MKQHEVTVPQIGLIAGTRAMLGASIVLSLSEKLSCEQRRAIGVDASRRRRGNNDSTCAAIAKLSIPLVRSKVVVHALERPLFSRLLPENS